MAVRNEVVRLSLDDDFSTGMARAAAMTASLNHQLKSLSGQSVSTARVTQNINRDTDAMAKSAQKADNSINQLTGRLRLMADVAAILGPSLIPIGALALPAVAGLANQFGAAALAGGAAIIAFQGVGDALTAMNEASLAPTAENMAKAREAMERLSPVAREMVLRLQELRPAMEGLRDVAATGLFPGVMEAFDDLETRIPEVERILSNVSKTLGNVLSEGAEGLASARWDEFFDFLATEVPGTMTSLGHIVGDLTHGMAELWMAFTPLNNDFNGWLEDIASGFDDWASGLAQTEGFREFIDYVRTTGPQVAETFAALGNAIVQIVQASAPLGGPVLAGLEAIAKVVATIADSDMGTPIMVAVGALALLNRGMATFAAVSRANLAGGITGPFASMRDGAEKARTSIGSLSRDVGTVATTYATAGARTERESKRMSDATRRIGESARGVGKAAAGIGALAVATTGIADGVGLSNTAMLGLAGTIAGPYGAAAGVAVGLAVDGASANNDFADALERVQTVLRDTPADFKAQNDAIAGAQASLAAFRDSINIDAGFWSAYGKALTNPGALKNALEGLFGDSDVKEMVDDLEEMQSQVIRNQQAWALLGDTMTGFKGPSTQISDLERLTEIAEGATPALNAMGLTIEDLAKMDPPEFQQVAEDIRSFNREADSVAGRMGNVGDAINGLDDDLLSTADSAESLSAALETLLSPALNAEEATDAFREGLAGMREEMKRTIETADGLEEINTERTFKGMSEAARINREVTRDRTRDIIAMMSAEAAAGATSRDLAATLRESRKAFIDEGVALGFSRKQMQERAREMGLTPKLVRTVFEAAGLDLTQVRVRELVDDLEKLPKKVRTELEQVGYEPSKDQIEDLTKKYDLTPKQVRTILNAKDNASDVLKEVDKRANALHKRKTEPKIGADDREARAKAKWVQDNLDIIHKKRPKPKIDADTRPATTGINTVNRELDKTGRKNPKPKIDALVAQALSNINNVVNAIANVHDKTVTVTVRTVRTGTNARGSRSTAGGLTIDADGGIHENGVKTFADGGYGLNGRYYQRVPQVVQGGANILWGEEETGKEAYISAKAGMEARNIAILNQAASWFGMGIHKRAADGAITGPQSVTNSGGNITNHFHVSGSDVKALARDITQRERDAMNLRGLPA